MPLDQVWNIYNSRADAENRIKELKQDFGLENFCMHDCWSTEASFRFIMVAYNLMSLFRHFALNHHNRAALKTLRGYCFALGAWTVHHAGRKVLKISLPVKKRRGWTEPSPKPRTQARLLSILMHNPGLNMMQNI